MNLNQRVKQIRPPANAPSWNAGYIYGIPVDKNFSNGDSIIFDQSVGKFVAFSASGPNPGLPGFQGVPGVTGPIGATGPQGPQGNRGPRGSVGPKGPQGPIGATGATGSQGRQGPIGAPGSMGSQGPQGATGFQGARGPQGLLGPQGISGSQGPTGITGINNVIGPQGPQGPQGPPAQEDYFVDQNWIDGDQFINSNYVTNYLLATTRCNENQFFSTVMVGGSEGTNLNGYQEYNTNISDDITDLFLPGIVTFNGNVVYAPKSNTIDGGNSYILNYNPTTMTATTLEIGADFGTTTLLPNNTIFMTHLQSAFLSIDILYNPLLNTYTSYSSIHPSFSSSVLSSDNKTVILLTSSDTSRNDYGIWSVDTTALNTIGKVKDNTYFPENIISSFMRLALNKTIFIGINSSSGFYFYSYNSSTNSLTQIQIPVTTNFSYIDAVNTIDGIIALIPEYLESTTDIVLVNPVTGSVSLSPINFGDISSSVFIQGFLLPNGYYLLVPSTSSTEIVLTPDNYTTGSYDVSGYTRMDIYLQGGGGGGGGGGYGLFGSGESTSDSIAPGAGGGGGGSGNYLFVNNIALSGGSVTINSIGTGGFGGNGQNGSVFPIIPAGNGQNGGTTSITYNAIVYSATGGNGGGGSNNIDSGIGGNGECGGGAGGPSTEYYYGGNIFYGVGNNGGNGSIQAGQGTPDSSQGNTFLQGGNGGGTLSGLGGLINTSWGGGGGGGGGGSNGGYGGTAGFNGFSGKNGSGGGGGGGGATTLSDPPETVNGGNGGNGGDGFIHLVLYKDVGTLVYSYINQNFEGGNIVTILNENSSITKQLKHTLYLDGSLLTMKNDGYIYRIYPGFIQRPFDKNYVTSPLVNIN